jgi:hypothetical protein
MDSWPGSWKSPLCGSMGSSPQETQFPGDLSRFARFVIDSVERAVRHTIPASATSLRTVFFLNLAEVLKDDSTRTVGGGERFSGIRGVPTTGRRYVRDIIPFFVSTSRGFTSVIIVSAILVNVVRGILCDIMMCHYWTRYEIALIYGLDYNAIPRPGFG